jgi:hypothetical protein
LEIVPTSPTEGRANIIGKVFAGAYPSTKIWNHADESGDCVLEIPRVPFCNPACGSDACVADGVCQAYPAVKQVGDVVVTGLNALDGSTSFTLIEVNGTYQKPPAVELAWPIFEEGGAVRFDAAGGDFTPFSLEAKGIAPLVVTSGNLALDPEASLDLTWEPASDPEDSIVHVQLDISHHGGTKGHIQCETADDGSLSIAAPLISQLIDLGVAGFPTILLSRRSVGSALVSAGRVDLTIYSNQELAVEVPGLVSCTDNSQCESGVCGPDLKCTTP